MKSTKNTLRFGALLSAATLTLAACGSDPVDLDDGETGDSGAAATGGSVLTQIEQAQIDRINSVYDYHKAFAALENAVGRPLEMCLRHRIPRS